MDLADLNLREKGEAGAWIDIDGPAGQKTDIRVKVAGLKSPRVAAAIEAHQRRLRDAVETKRGRQPDFDKLEAQRDDEIIVAAALDWQGVVLRGEALAFSTENVRKIMLDPGFDWLAAQVIQAARDAALFTKP